MLKYNLAPLNIKRLQILTLVGVIATTHFILSIQSSQPTITGINLLSELIKPQNTTRRLVVFGDRNSGASFLRDLLLDLFDLSLASDFGNETYHFGAGRNLSHDCEDILFVAVVRNPLDWIMTMKKDHAALAHLNTSDTWEDVLFSDWRPGGVAIPLKEEEEDGALLWLQKNKKYSSIFELRAWEGLFMSEDLPGDVRNFVMVKYEDIIGGRAAFVVQKMQEEFRIQWRRGTSEACMALSLVLFLLVVIIMIIIITAYLKPILVR